MTVRRFRVIGEVPELWRDQFRDRLEEYAFKDRVVVGSGNTGEGKEELEGWVQVHNLLDNTFVDFSKWLYNEYAVFALRNDKKSLPAKLFNATVAKKCEAWCQEQGVERCPNAIKKQIKEELEADWLKRALPRVNTIECCWNVAQGWLLLHSLSESATDRFRKRFLRTFGLKLVPVSPLEWVGDDSATERLIGSAPSDLAELLRESA